MTKRQKDHELHRARIHMQFVSRMYKLQHEDGRYFLHEHCQSELPRAKLMSVSQFSCFLPTFRRKECGIEREAHSDGN